MKKLILLFFACLLLSSCHDTIKGKSIAELQIPVFHNRLDAGQYNEIYDATADGFKKVTTKEKMNQLLSAINRKLGAVKSSEVVNWNVTTRNFTTYVVLVSKTEFEKGTGTETFTFIVSGTNANLAGYNMNSLDMMTQ